MQTIQAVVNPRLLTKANRLFTGSLSGRIIEILQNARRAGAAKVVINNRDGLVTVRDDGYGVEDFARLIDLGGSGWDELEASEDPAGVGLFCLAPRRVTICSRGQIVVIEGDGWSGAPVLVQTDPDPRPGAILRFEDEPWSKQIVEPLAVFTGMDVIVDSQRCAQLPFVGKHATHHPELGCRIEVRASNELDRWHMSGRFGQSDHVLVNFHGQVVSFDCRPVSEHSLHYLIDLTGEPTGIRLMLPARTRVVENDAFAQLKGVLELEAFRYLQRRGTHRLPYKEYLRAQQLGVALPEATPTFKVGLISSADLPEPVAITKSDDWPLARCYRFDPSPDCGEESDEPNAHLLAALGKFAEPFIPVDIRAGYDDYSWARLPTIEKVEVQVGRELHSAYLWSGKLTCVDALTVIAHTSDGRLISSPVCMAIAQPPEENPSCLEEYVLVTPDAERLLSLAEIWYHLGGWYEEGDTYDTQARQFDEELEEFWANLRGPDEQLRRRFQEVAREIRPKWKSIEVLVSGDVRIHFAKGKVKTITRSPSAP